MHIRYATEADAEAIGRIIGAVWAEESAEPARIRYAITSSDHATLVALRGLEPVGFIDGFCTVAADGATRWEIDLVAVHPAHQGNGFGRTLITACTAEGRRRGAQTARALVHAGNLASQSAFARCTYQVSNHTVKLVIAGDQAPSADPAPDTVCHLVRVATCRYTGVWLEQPLTEAGFRAARAAQLTDQLETAGAVLPETVPAGLGWLALGHYRWWTRSLSD